MQQSPPTVVRTVAQQQQQQQLKQQQQQQILQRFNIIPSDQQNQLRTQLQKEIPSELKKRYSKDEFDALHKNPQKLVEARLEIARDMLSKAINTPNLAVNTTGLIVSPAPVLPVAPQIPASVLNNPIHDVTSAAIVNDTVPLLPRTSGQNDMRIILDKHENSLNQLSGDMSKISDMMNSLMVMVQTIAQKDNIDRQTYVPSNQPNNKPTKDVEKSNHIIRMSDSDDDDSISSASNEVNVTTKLVNNPPINKPVVTLTTKNTVIQTTSSDIPNTPKQKQTRATQKKHKKRKHEDNETHKKSIKTSSAASDESANMIINFPDPVLCKIFVYIPMSKSYISHTALTCKRFAGIIKSDAYLNEYMGYHYQIYAMNQFFPWKATKVDATVPLRQKRRGGHFKSDKRRKNKSKKSDDEKDEEHDNDNDADDDDNDKKQDSQYFGNFVQWGYVWKSMEDKISEVKNRMSMTMKWIDDHHYLGGNITPSIILDPHYGIRDYFFPSKRCSKTVMRQSTFLYAMHMEKEKQMIVVYLVPDEIPSGKKLLAQNVALERIMTLLHKARRTMRFEPQYTVTKSSKPRTVPTIQMNPNDDDDSDSDVEPDPELVKQMEDDLAFGLSASRGSSNKSGYYILGDDTIPTQRACTLWKDHADWITSDTHSLMSICVATTIWASAQEFISNACEYKHTKRCAAPLTVASLTIDLQRIHYIMNEKL